MLPETIDLSNIRMPAGSAEEMAFDTFQNYLEATCAWNNRAALFRVR